MKTNVAARQGLTIDAHGLNALRLQTTQTPWRLIEAGFGARDAWAAGHIPGADYLDTRELERLPLWNRIPDAALFAALARHGISADTPVILYSRNNCAAARVAHLFLYAGIANVQLLDGGWQGWLNAGFDAATGAPFIPQVQQKSAPLRVNTRLFTDIHQLRRHLKHNDATLVSIRSWAEHTGQTSGYDYIEAKGDIPGARWGGDYADLINPDGSWRSAQAITAMWQRRDITAQQKVIFYCGTGWRASAAFMAARAMGWENISVYDGGWFEWSSTPQNRP